MSIIQIGGNVCLSGPFVFVLSLFIDQSGSQYDGEKNRILEMSVGAGRCQNEICGNFVSNHSGSRPSQHIR